MQYSQTNTMGLPSQLGSYHNLFLASASCASVTLHSWVANSASCAFAVGLETLQSCRYAPDWPFSSGAVAAYTAVAAPCTVNDNA